MGTRLKTLLRKKRTKATEWTAGNGERFFHNERRFEVWGF